MKITVYILSGTARGIPILNCGFKNDTPNGMNKFHGTAQVVIRKSTSNTSFPIKNTINPFATVYFY